VATDTTIEWADKTWSPIIGCDRVSPGCDSCYAISTARIRESNPHPAIAAAFAGTTQRTDTGVDWSGKVNLLQTRLAEPLHWKKPRKVFVNSLSDLFHKNVPDEFIAQVFAIMALTPQHTYQILTKRHARMRSLLNNPDFEKQVDRTLLTMPAASDPKLTGRSWPLPKPGWPLPNVHLGVSVENQHWADIRIPALLDTPAAVRWISAEPLLGPIDLLGKRDYHGHRPTLTYWLTGRPELGQPRTTDTGMQMHPLATGPRLDWVVAGGESGPKARPPHPDWFRTLRNQCAAANIPYLFKQWGDWGPEWPLDKDGHLLTTPRGLGVTVANDGTVYQPGELAYPDGPRYGEAVRAGHDKASLTAMYRLGKKKAGRELDGREHNEFPAVAT
jgi:protein gp37